MNRRFLREGRAQVMSHSALDRGTLKTHVICRAVRVVKSEIAIAATEVIINQGKIGDGRATPFLRYPVNVVKLGYYAIYVVY